MNTLSHKSIPLSLGMMSLFFLFTFLSTSIQAAESTAPVKAKAVKVKITGYLSCKGKGIYYSKADGVKACYSCPKNMKRTSPTRKMDHPKACVNREGKNTYAPAQKLGLLYKQCKKGQFQIKNRCGVCPSGYKYSSQKKLCYIATAMPKPVDNLPTPEKISGTPLYNCKGKGIYYSKVDGVKSCYACPKGMKRTSPTRKMDHAKACVNREGKNTYATGIRLGTIMKSCDKNGDNCQNKFKAIVGKPIDWYKQFKGVY